MTAVDRAHRFLHLHGMHPDDLDLSAELDKLLANMEKGLSGLATPRDCQMLPAYLSLTPPIPSKERVLALDLGGTNLRAALVSFPEGFPVVEELRTHPIPGLDSPIRWEDFLREVALFAAPLAAEAKRLGVCFSYQAEITPNRDGRVICFSKEVQVNGCEGNLVCRGLLDAFAALGLPAFHSFALVNDTVAAMLGCYSHRRVESDGVLGLILGTGTNLCYTARTSHIHRPLHSWTAPNMVVNMEAGVYSGLPQGDFDRALDKASMSPGTYGCEKMVGGAYQGEVLRLALAAAGRELFSPGFEDRLALAGPLTSAHLSAYALQPRGDNSLASLCATQDDFIVMDTLTDLLLERAARVVILMLAAPMTAEDMGRRVPALVAAEGSAYRKNPPLKQKIARLSREYLQDTLGRHCVFAETDNPNLPGAALAATQPLF